MAEAPRSRRSTLGALIASVLGGLALWRFLTPRGGARSSSGVSVPISDVPREGALALPEERLAIVRQGDEVLALDLVCTHLGCTVTATERGFACPCHGSRFDGRGQVLDGPAPRALRRLSVEREGDSYRVSRA